MIAIKGKYTNAEIFTTNTATAIDNYAVAQIQYLCDNPTLSGSTIKVMPDVHPGIVGTIGLTMTIGEKLMPNLVGVDIGCGMSIMQIKNKNLEFQQLDKAIRDNIPVGFKTRSTPHRFAEDFDFTQLKCFKHINQNKASLSLGTLGGGNHFIEADKDDDGNIYIVVHSGSRHFGKEVTEYYLNAGHRILKEKGEDIPFELTYLDGKILTDYIADLQLLQEFACLNRKAILDELIKKMKFKVLDSYTCIHNYIDSRDETVKALSRPVLRKGAISALSGEKVIIPINMRDGIILGTGKGNTGWNCSAPHGAGRIIKRTEVKNQYTVSAFKKDMHGIYSSCISKETLDEAPFAYRNLEDIRQVISDTVKTDKILKPIYNFKAGN